MASRLTSVHALSRLAVLASLTIGLLGTTSGLAAADTATPPKDSGPTVDGTTTPTDPGSATDPTSTPPTDPTISYTMPKATAHMRSARAHSQRARIRARHAREVHSVVRVARAQHGKPYVYGASGPSAFDCSGLTRFVFGHAIGRWLPHNAEAQYRSVQHITRRNLRVGDLVFQESNGYAFHVGIYAGHGTWWDAPHSGARVHRQPIFRGAKFYGRVLTMGFAQRNLPHQHRSRHAAKHHRGAAH